MNPVLQKFDILEDLKDMRSEVALAVELIKSNYFNRSATSKLQDLDQRRRQKKKAKQNLIKIEMALVSLLFIYF